MADKIEKIEGIGPVYVTNLAGVGVKTTDDLVTACGSPSGRQEVAGKTGLTEAQLLKWANMADLMRISGIGCEYAELLEASGVDTVKELRTRNAESLASRMTEVNEARKLTRQTPAPAVVEKWISQAKSLEPKITY